jgi:hypothetical protein
MSLTGIAVLNSLLGGACGLWFRVQILIPLVALAFIEVTILKHTSVRYTRILWSAIVLMCSVEIGYLIGSSLGAFWLFSGREKVERDFTRGSHGRLSPH